MTSPYGVLYPLSGGEPDVPFADLLRAGLRRMRVTVDQPMGTNFARLDRCTAAVRAVGGEVYLTLNGGKGVSPNTVNRAAFVAWAAAVARHVATWPSPVILSVWNEPTATALAYDALLLSVFPALRAAAPRARIAAGDFHGKDVEVAGGWVQQWLALPSAKQVDLHSAHVIPPINPLADALAQARAIRATFPQTKPLRLTEVGYSSVEAFQEPAHIGVAGQAAWLRAALPQVIALGYEAVYWALYRADGYAPDGPYGGNGLVDSTNRRKPACAAFRVLLGGGH